MAGSPGRAAASLTPSVNVLPCPARLFTVRSQPIRDRHIGGKPLCLRARRERRAEFLRQRTRPKRFLAQREPTFPGPRAIDNQRGQRGEMLGRALYVSGPLPLALGKVGSRDEL